jgi:hypothetical protein
MTFHRSGSHPAADRVSVVISAKSRPKFDHCGWISGCSKKQNSAVPGAKKKISRAATTVALLIVLLPG